MLANIYSKYSWIFDVEYDPSDNSNSSLYVGTGILNVLLIYDFFIFFHVYYMLRLDRATNLSPLCKFILSIQLSKFLQGPDVLLLLEFLNIVFILELYPYWNLFHF